MRLSLKLAALVGVLTALVVWGISWVSLQRDVGIVQDDVARNAELVAITIAAMAGDLSPEDDMVHLVDSINAEESAFEVIWVPPGSVAAAEGGPQVDVGVHSVTAKVPVDGGGAVMVVESLARRDELWARSVGTMTATAIAITILSVLVGLWVGRLMVGRPVDALVRKTREVARGDFSRPALVGGSDELATLAYELNLMAGQLEAARRRSTQEMDARIQAEVQLRHADRLRTVGQLAAGMAHELGTPLNVISGRAMLLRRGLGTEHEATGHVTIIAEQTRRITDIVRRLLDYSRQTPAARADVDLSALVRDTVSMLSTEASARGCMVRVGGPAGIHAAVDPEQLRQVVTNLVMNALQAVQEEGLVELTLAEVAEPQPGVRLWVDDDGPGVDPALRDSVFDPFFTTKEPGQGTGLGLAVVQGIVAEHGGSLSLGESPLGGARFEVVLPRTMEVAA